MSHDNERSNALNLQNDTPTNLCENLKNHFFILFNVTSCQDASQIFPKRLLIEETLRLQLNLAPTPEHVTELNALGEQLSLVAVDKFAVFGKKI